MLSQDTYAGGPAQKKAHYSTQYTAPGTALSPTSSTAVATGNDGMSPSTQTFPQAHDAGIVASLYSVLQRVVLAGGCIAYATTGAYFTLLRMLLPGRVASQVLYTCVISPHKAQTM